MKLEAICAIEMMTNGLYFKNGDSLLQSPAYYAHFCRSTRNRNIICDQLGYWMLPEAILKDPKRNVIICDKNTLPIQLFSDKKCVVVGSKSMFEILEGYINIWRISWYAKKVNEIERKKLVKYRPNLINFTLVSQDFSDGFLSHAVYRRNKRGFSDYQAPILDLVA